MDRRTQYTKKIIKETCLELLEEKDITKVSVSELCKKADINRATFYRYYLDIFDLLKKIEDDFVEELKGSYKNFNLKDNAFYDYVSALLKTCLNNKKLVKVLFYSNNNISFLNAILEDAYVRFKDKWRNDVPNINEKEIEYASIYIFNGTLGLVNYWIQNDFTEEIEDITKSIVELSYYGSNKFIYKK